MATADLLGHVEFAVLDAVHRGALRSRQSARQVPCLCEQPAGDALLHRALRRCEQQGLLRSRRDARGRSYELTAAGRARLRIEWRFRAALGRVLLPAARQLNLCHA
jgi:DNA-binding PadR family transcriptional regulator